MENNGGKGLFYGVIGVATLIVAIIGATFAYFTATATDNTTVVGTAATVGIAMAVERIQPDATQYEVGMIPLNADDVQDAIDANCVATGTNNYTACHIYKVTITNNSSSPLTVAGNLVLGGEMVNIVSSTLTLADGGTIGAQTEKTSTMTLVHREGGSDTIAVNGTQDYFFIVYLNNLDSGQDSADAGKNYTGTVTFNAAGGSSVKATFSSGT